MKALKFLGRHWGKLLFCSFSLFCFLVIFDIDPISDMMEYLGYNSGRMEHVQRVGRLAPFPLERSHLKVRESSTMFSHMVTIYFTAEPEVISQWMKNSPGIQEATPHEARDNTTEYPLWGKGAGVVYISNDRTEVGVNLGQAVDGPTANSPIPLRYPHGQGP